MTTTTPLPKGTLPCPVCGSLMSGSDSAQAEWVLAEHVKREHPDQPVPGHLPAPIGDRTGALDLDGMRAAIPQVRDGLVLGLRHAATLMRQQRGAVVEPEDTYPLVRKLTEADEVLGQWARAFADAAAEARALIEEEALAVPGAEADGALAHGLYVPDGEGRRIAVRADWKPGASTWDVASLVGWLIDDEVAEVKGERRAEARARYEARQAAADPGAEGIEPEPLDPVAAAAEAAWYESDARHIAGQVVARLLGLGSYKPHASKVKALRTKLAERQRDADAAVIAGVRTTGPRTYLGVKIEREDAPQGGAR